MASKKYTGKTCAYCGTPDVSATRDHVVAKEFFLKEDRANLPLVPACRRCNGEKATLEHYALSVLPFGSRHIEARRYSEENIERRLRKNQALRSSLTVTRSGSWERHPNGLLVPAVSINIEMDKIFKLVAFIVRGFYTFHWRAALDQDWFADPFIFHPDHENHAINSVMPYMDRSTVVQGNLGRATFVYRGIRSSHIPQLSVWQLTLLGGLQFGGDTRFPDGRFPKFSIVTRQTEAAAKVTRKRTEEEKAERSKTL